MITTIDEEDDNNVLLELNGMTYLNIDSTYAIEINEMTHKCGS